MCPLCLVKMAAPGDALRLAHNREVHGLVHGWKDGRQGRKGRGSQPPKVGKWRAFNGQDRRGGAHESHL